MNTVSYPSWYKEWIGQVTSFESLGIPLLYGGLDVSMQVVVVFLYNQSSLFIGQALGVVKQGVIMHGSQSHGQTSLSLNKVRGNR